MRRTIHLLAAAASTAALAGAANASETITYSYDELGRLIGTSRTGSVNQGVSRTIDYDPAGNRTIDNVTGSSGIAAAYDPAANMAWIGDGPSPGTGGGAFEPGRRPHGTAFLRAVSGGDRASMPAGEAGADRAGEPSDPSASPF